jgi:hypothetical protein
MKKLGLAVTAAAILLAGSVSYGFAQQDQNMGGGTKAAPGQTQQRGKAGNAPSQRDTSGTTRYREDRNMGRDQE